MTVSILMAVYNAEAYLEQALRSLLCQQSLHDLEVLAVDDCSTDSSLQILQQWAAQDARLRVFQTPQNSGQAVARNLALRHAQGDYITMVDADDWLSPDALQSAVDVFNQYPKTDCVLFHLVQHWQETNRDEDYPMPVDVDVNVDSSLPASRFYCLTGEQAIRLSLDWQIHGYYLVRRELHLRYPYDESCLLYSDDNTTHIHYLHSREVRFCKGRYYWRRHESSTTTAISPRRFLHIEANLSLRHTLVQEHVASDILEQFDQRRWHVYLGQLWLFFTHRSTLSKDDCARVRESFRRIYPTFHRRLPYPLFVASQWLRWRRRRLIYGQR